MSFLFGFAFLLFLFGFWFVLLFLFSFVFYYFYLVLGFIIWFCFCFYYFYLGFGGFLGVFGGFWHFSPKMSKTVDFPALADLYLNGVSGLLCVHVLSGLSMLVRRCALRALPVERALDCVGNPRALCSPFLSLIHAVVLCFCRSLRLSCKTQSRSDEVNAR